ncbi:MAG TPA: hypothetical protein VF746_04200 [Longimicrobium sp.]
MTSEAGTARAPSREVRRLTWTPGTVNAAVPEKTRLWSRKYA